MGRLRFRLLGHAVFSEVPGHQAKVPSQLQIPITMGGENVLRN